MTSLLIEVEFLHRLTNSLYNTNLLQMAFLFNSVEVVTHHSLITRCVCLSTPLHTISLTLYRGKQLPLNIKY